MKLFWWPNDDVDCAPILLFAFSLFQPTTTIFHPVILLINSTFTFSWTFLLHSSILNLNSLGIESLTRKSIFNPQTSIHFHPLQPPQFKDATFYNHSESSNIGNRYICSSQQSSQAYAHKDGKEGECGCCCNSTWTPKWHRGTRRIGKEGKL